MLTAAILAGSAKADGDPASDVLATQALFLPWDANVPAEQQAGLASMVAGARRHGFAIRVALIASADDLGSVSALWRLPQQYAEFLGQELSLVYKGPLLVVMPDGFGLDGLGLTADTLDATLSGIRVPTDGAQLAQVTNMAIERLASATGHPLPSRSPAAAPGYGNERSTGTASWIVFLVGCLSIAAAWTVSLRARPLRTPRTGSAPT